MHRFDHIDLRVRTSVRFESSTAYSCPDSAYRKHEHSRLAAIFYQGEGPTEFFGVTQSAGHTPNENRIAFRASSIAEVDEIAQVLREIGAPNIEGPGYEDSEGITPCSSKILPATGLRSVTARRIKDAGRAQQGEHGL